MNHFELKKKALERNDVRIAYNSMETEFLLLKELLKARQKAGLSQADIAQLMGTKAPTITKLETSLRTGKQLPSLTILKKYANVLGCRLDIKLIPA